MVLNIQIKKNLKIILILKEKNKIIDKINWQDKQNLLEKLLPQIDLLLSKNQLSVQDLEDINLKIAIEESCSTYRIAKATGETLKYCLKKK
jgi:hypothetical protein